MYLPTLDTPLIIEQPQTPPKKLEKKIKIPSEKIKIPSDDVLTIRKEIISFKNEIENNLSDFFQYPINPLNYPHLYVYYYITDAISLAKDYFPAEINAEFLPPLEKVKKELLPLAKEEYLETPDLEIEIYGYIQKEDKKVKAEKIFQDYTKQAILFKNNVESYLAKFQELESKYFFKVLTPMPPKEKETVYLSSILKLYPKAQQKLATAIKLFLNYLKGKRVKISPLDEYKFYIDALSKERGF